ncbi:MAG: hypothetical protein IPM07_08540 [Anaerolineales bacterium]|nr:hypothetical protein [Anaerolineales bacterium]
MLTSTSIHWLSLLQLAPLNITKSPSAAPSAARSVRTSPLGKSSTVTTLFW